MSCSCQCNCSGHCACGEGETLRAPDNRPGRITIEMRLGDYAAFLDDAWRRLASRDTPELSRLGTREGSDPTMALVDAWAVAADLLTFYNERLANEGYLRTAREEFSVRALAELVAYRPRPGVAATVPLAFLLDANATPVEIPVGARAQTVPGPGETAQTFETDEPLLARAEWSEMRPRLTRPPRIGFYDALVRDRLWLSDAMLIVHPGEKILFVFDNKRLGQVVREVASAIPDVVNGRQLLHLKPIPNLTLTDAMELLRAVKAADLSAKERLAMLEAVESFLLGGSLKELAVVLLASYGGEEEDDDIRDMAMRMAKLALSIVGRRPEASGPVEGTSSAQQLYPQLERMPARQPRSARDMQQSAKALLGERSDGPLQLAAALSPAIGEQLHAAWSQMQAAEQAGELQSVHVLRVTAGAFGGNVPPMVQEEGHRFTLSYPPRAPEDNRALHLDAIYDGIKGGSYAVLHAPVRAARYPEEDEPHG
ncbi:hypothetical protein [Ensifer sp.]|jgi:hypothetical protein|uniref:hypothetical protein n=1 Tax=Ensifer sp. TaxID=1872086 RepID=UPI002E14F6B5|nr:hypothetical protein [Ensifer sp.]